MTDAIIEFFRKSLNNDFLTVFLVAILPIIELRGSILMAFNMGMNAFFAFGLSYIGSSIVVPVLLLLFIPILNWLKKFKFFKNFAFAVESIFKNKADKIEAKLLAKQGIANLKTGEANNANELNNTNEINKTATTNNAKAFSKTVNNKNCKMLTTAELSKKVMLYKLLGVFLFVALPLPMTGVWTGSVVAIFLGLGFWKSLLVVLSGNMVAGIIMTLLAIFFKKYIDTILMVFLILVVLLLLLFIIKVILKTIKEQKKQKNKTNS